MTAPTTDHPYVDGLSKLPAHMVDSVIRYIDYGIPPGHFLTAVFSNQFVGAFHRADDTNIVYMKAWASFIYNDAPGNSHGSPSHVRDWIKSGGLVGQGMAKAKSLAEEGMEHVA